MAKSKSNSNDVIGMVEDVFSKAPALPANIRETLVKIAPIIALVFGILGLVAGLSGIGLLTAFLPFAVLGGVGTYGTGYVAAGVLLVSSVLMLAAYPGLQKRSLSGWNLMFWSEVVSLLGSVISLSFVSGIVGALIAFYLLFQVKSHYK